MAVWQVIEKKYKQADRALDKHDPKQAVRLLRDLVESEPREPLFHWRLGFALSEMKEYRRAILELQKALDLDPENVAALGCLGRAYMELGEWKQAEKAIKHRLALKKSAVHYVFLAHIMMATNRYDSAVEYCLKAIELDSSFAEAFLNLGLAYQHKKRFGKAIGALEKAVEFDRENAVAFRELGLTYYSVGEFDLAKQALWACLALNREDAWGHLYLALCLQDMNQTRNAAAHFAAALRSDPRNPFFRKKQQEFLRWNSKGVRTKGSKRRTSP